MAKIEESVLINRSVGDVWKFINDISKVPTWDSDVLELRLTSEGPMGVGTTGEFRAKMRNMTILIRVTEYEPDRRISFEHLSGPMKGSIITFSVEPVEGKTRFTNINDLKLSGLYKLVGPLMIPSMRRGVVTGLCNAKRMLESEGQK